MDLVVTAESLFLADADPFQGELTFRSSVRAATFIEHPKYQPREVLDLMYRAYRARSATVHAGRTKSAPDTSLPDDESATVDRFTDCIEDLMRLAIRKALSMGAGADSLRDRHFWVKLILPDR